MGVILQKSKAPSKINKAPIKFKQKHNEKEKNSANNINPLQNDPRKQIMKTISSTYKNYNPVGDIKELESGIDSDISPVQKFYTENNEQAKKVKGRGQKDIISEKKILHLKKSKATDLLLQRMEHEKSLEIQNKSTFQQNSSLYLNYFEQIKPKKSKSPQNKEDLSVIKDKNMIFQTVNDKMEKIIKNRVNAKENAKKIKNNMESQRVKSETSIKVLDQKLMKKIANDLKQEKEFKYGEIFEKKFKLEYV